MNKKIKVELKVEELNTLIEALTEYANTIDQLPKFKGQKKSVAKFDELTKKLEKCSV